MPKRLRGPCSNGVPPPFRAPKSRSASYNLGDPFEINVPMPEETQKLIASRKGAVTLVLSRAVPLVENLARIASRKWIEAHHEKARRIEIEPRSCSASHGTGETRRTFASRGNEEARQKRTCRIDYEACEALASRRVYEDHSHGEPSFDRGPFHRSAPKLLRDPPIRSEPMFERDPSA